MAMQDHAKANHDLGKDAKVNHVRDKDSMVATPFLVTFFSYFSLFLLH